MDRLIRLARVAALYGAWFGGALLIAAALVIVADVLLRKVFSVSLGGAHELSNFALAISTAWAFSFTLLARAHVRIESLYVILPARLGALLDLIAHAMLTAVVIFLTWHGFFVFEKSAAMGSRTLTPLASPLAVPQFFWFLGLLFFAAVAVLLLVRSIFALVTGDIATVQRIIGPRGVSQELAEEMRSAQERRAGPAAKR